MKKTAHLIYLTIIAVVLVLFILKRTPCDEAPGGIEKQTQRFDKAPKINWTYGVDYETLTPIHELSTNDPELKEFIKNLYLIFRTKNWMQIIEISNKDHYAEQGEFLGNDTAYIENNISIYSHWQHKVVVKNQLESKIDEGFDRLNQIKSLKLIGMDPNGSYGKTMKFYGYVEKENGIMLAVYLLITKRSGKYELTGEVG